MIRLLKAWKTWPAGHIFPDMPPNQASLLVGRGIAEAVTSSVRAPAQEAMRAGRNYVTRTGKQGRG